MQVSTGITITFDTGFFAEILEVNGPDGSRESINTSHMGTLLAHTFTPAKLVDWGSLSVNIGFESWETPPINSVAETVTLTFPNGDTWAFSGFMTGFSLTAPLEDKITADCTVKISGDVTITDTSPSGA